MEENKIKKEWETPEFTVLAVNGETQSANLNNSDGNDGNDS